MLFDQSAEPKKVEITQDYQQLLMQKVGEKLPELATYPILQYPNRCAIGIPERFPEEKVLLFGYGSLMNVESASRSVTPEAVASMRPVVAFGVKRVFNYKAGKTDRWGKDQHPLEKAMLNLTPTTSPRNMVNGVLLEVDAENFTRLVERETGYDLVPILVADWDNIKSENPNVTIRVAYTFIASDEIRNGVDYVQTKYYPVRGYLKATREGALAFGQDFLDFWNETTYLANGTTPIKEWDEKTFQGKLCSKES